MKWVALFLLSLFLAPAAAGADALAEGRPLPQTLGESGHVIRVGADHIVRRQGDGAVLLDLRGNARICQGADVVAGPRLIAWLETVGPADRKVCVLDVYGEASARVSRDGARIHLGEVVFVRLTTSEGLVLSGDAAVADDASAVDEFRDRAEAFRTLGPAGVASQVAEGSMFGEVRPSAEEMVIEDLTDAGMTVTLHGNAKIVYEDLILSADTIRLRVSFKEKMLESPELESVYAEGAVSLERGTERITSDAIILDVRLEEALAHNGRIRMTDPAARVPMQFHAGAIRQISRDRFAAEGPGYFTTSRFAAPHYRIEGRDIRLVRGPGLHRLREQEVERAQPAERPGGGPQEAVKAPESLVVSSRNNLLYLGPVPVFYWPYIAKDVRSGAFLIKSADVGRSSNLGNFLQLEWNLYDLGLYFNEWSDLTLRTDLFSERGLGTGLDFSYEGATRQGFARGYYINDTAEEDDRGLPVPRSDRGEVTVRHRELLTCLPGDWRADLELGYLSDLTFLRTYDRDEFDEGKDRETQIFVSGISHNQMVTAQVKGRINDFQNTVERQSVAYHVIGQPVFGSPLLLTSHADLSNLRLRMDEDLVGVTDSDWVTRLDAASEVSLPVQIGPVRADPFVWGDATTYSDRTDDDSTVRGATAFGVRTASNFYRTYHVRNETLGVDRLRHVITPTVEYLNRWAVTESPGHFVQHDEIDALDESHRLTLGLRNRLQTYRPASGGPRPVDYVFLDVDYAFHLRDSSGDRNLDDSVEASAGWLATENIEIASEDNRYNVEESRLEEVNTRLRLKFWRPVDVSVGHKYYVDLADPGEATHSIGMFGMAYRPRFGRWQVDFNTTYDFQARRRAGDTKDPRRLGSGIFFTRDLEGWRVTIGAELNQGRANETILRFNITPPGTRD